MARDNDDVATKFLMHGVQDWGQAHEHRQQATTAYLTAAGFDVEPSGVPVFGAMFPIQKIVGKDGEAAFTWLKETLAAMPRGKFEREAEHLSNALAARQQRDAA